MDEISDIIMLNICVVQYAILALAVQTLINLYRPKPKNVCRKWWIRPILQRRDTEGSYQLLMSKSISDGFHYENYLRMDKITFFYLLSKIELVISRQDTQLRRSISAAEKLAVTLRYLATGMIHICNIL
jgi:hypothetical protein